MKKKVNEKFISKEHLELIAEAFKKEESASSSLTLDEFERLGIEVKGGNCKIKSGVLTYIYVPSTIPVFPTGKKGESVLSQAEIQRLKEAIASWLQQKNDGEPHI